MIIRGMQARLERSGKGWGESWDTTTRLDGRSSHARKSDQSCQADSIFLGVREESFGIALGSPAALRYW